MFRFQIKKTKIKKVLCSFQKTTWISSYLFELQKCPQKKGTRHPPVSSAMARRTNSPMSHIRHIAIRLNHQNLHPVCLQKNHYRKSRDPPRCFGDLCFSKRSGNFQLCRHLAAAETRRLRGHQVVHASGLEYENQRRGRNHGKKNMEKQLYTCKNM